MRLPAGSAKLIGPVLASGDLRLALEKTGSPCPQVLRPTHCFGLMIPRSSLALAYFLLTKG